jgi:1-deoxy-D-xylulose-5-phosphate reductoisomerase
VHSFVKFTDGSVLGQCGWPDMRLPIAYALLYPERRPNALKPWNPTETPNLTFEPVDEKTFVSLQLAREAARVGSTMPCAMNAANEEAANAFLKGMVKFLQIPEIVECSMDAHAPQTATLDNLLATDAETRSFVRRYIDKAA